MASREGQTDTAGSTGWNDPVRCQWCGSFHSARCPQVQAIEFHQNGAVKRVEFVKPEQIDWKRVIEAAGNTQSVWQPLTHYGWGYSNER